MRAERLLLVRINASGGLILRMGAINRCLKHPLARDTPVCLLAVLGEQHSGKSFLLDHLLRGLPGLVRRAGLTGGCREAKGEPTPYPRVGSGRGAELSGHAEWTTFFSTFRNLATVASQEQRGPCLESDGVLMASPGASGCGATPSC